MKTLGNNEWIAGGEIFKSPNSKKSTKKSNTNRYTFGKDDLEINQRFSVAIKDNTVYKNESNALKKLNWFQKLLFVPIKLEEGKWVIMNKSSLKKRLNFNTNLGLPIKFLFDKKVSNFNNS
jgi:hypothetical protein